MNVSDVHKTILAVILLLSILLFFSKMTGYLTFTSLNVSIKEKKEAALLLDFQPLITILQSERIRAEVVNIGSVPFNETMTIRIYIYNVTIKPVIDYQDSFFFLYPGDRHAFPVTFTPISIGTYYIEARAKFDGKVVQTWGRFDVIYPPEAVRAKIPVRIEPVYLPPEKVPSYVPTIVFLAPPKLEIYVKNITASQGSETIVPILLKNFGEREAFDIRPFISIPKDLEFSLSPLNIPQLSPNETVSFSLTIKIPENFPIGLYQIVFEVSSNETKASSSFYLNITKKPVDLTQELYEKILSVEFLLTQAKSRMYSLALKGIDVSRVNSTLEVAGMHLELAKDYLKKKDFKACEENIRKANEEISQALLEMETLLLIRPKAYPVYLFVVIAILAFIVILLLIMVYKRKKGERPRLLREAEKESLVSTA